MFYFRKLPPNRIAQTFFGRKFRYAINAQVLGGIDRIIYDLNLGSPGKFPDSITWRVSPVKIAVEQQPLPQFRVAGDSAYAKSRLLVTPYRTAEAAADPSKRLFNLRFCGMRTECTENIYGKQIMNESGSTAVSSHSISTVHTLINSGGKG